MKDQQPVKENAENFTSGEDVLKKPAFSLHEQKPKTEEAIDPFDAIFNSVVKALQRYQEIKDDGLRFTIGMGLHGMAEVLKHLNRYADERLAEERALWGKCEDHYRAALHTVEGNYQWQPIESAPKDGTTVILYAFNAALEWDVVGYGRWDGVGLIAGWISRGFTEPPGNLGLAHPTHWMPLPKPPALVTAERERV